MRLRKIFTQPLILTATTTFLQGCLSHTSLHLQSEWSFHSMKSDCSMRTKIATTISTPIDPHKMLNIKTKHVQSSSQVRTQESSHSRASQTSPLSWQTPVCHCTLLVSSQRHNSPNLTCFTVYVTFSYRDL